MTLAVGYKVVWTELTFTKSWQGKGGQTTVTATCATLVPATIRNQRICTMYVDITSPGAISNRPIRWVISIKIHKDGELCRIVYRLKIVKSDEDQNPTGETLLAIQPDGKGTCWERGLRRTKISVRPTVCSVCLPPPFCVTSERIHTALPWLLQPGKRVQTKTEICSKEGRLKRGRVHLVRDGILKLI